MLPSVVNVEAYRYSESGIEIIVLPVSAEYNFRFLLNGREYLSAPCYGRDLEDIAVGYLYSEGIISSRNQIRGIKVHDEDKLVDVITSTGVHFMNMIRGKIHALSACRIHAAAEAPRLPINRKLPEFEPWMILSAAAEFYNISTTNPQTHSVHSAALYDFSGKRTAYCEEIQKQNAIEKLIGSALMKGLQFEGMMLLSTGRITGDIARKLSRTGIPIIITRKAPTNLAIELVREYNIILITGVAEDHFYIHHGIDHIRRCNHSCDTKNKASEDCQLN